MKAGKKKLYLILAQLSVVFIWYAITVVQWANNPKYDINISLPLTVRGIEAFVIFLVCTVLIYLFEKLKVKPGAVNRIIILIGLYGVSLMTNILALYVRKLAGYSPPPIDNYFFIQSLHFYIPILLVVITYATYKNRLEVQLAKEEKLKAESLAQQAKWMMLRYQVNPHFLFNALNSVRALIGTNNENAKKAITEIAEYFRYTLNNEHNATTTLNDELEAVQNYLSIQKIRFQDDIIIEYNIDPDTLNIEIPAFSIQILAENAVKYGLKTSAKPVMIQIGSFGGETTTITISNSGHLYKNKTTPDSTRTGLANLEKRLKILYSKSEVLLEEQKDKVQATIAITKTKKHGQN